MITTVFCDSMVHGVRVVELFVVVGLLVFACFVSEVGSDGNCRVGCIGGSLS